MLSTNLFLIKGWLLIYINIIYIERVLSNFIFFSFSKDLNKAFK